MLASCHAAMFPLAWMRIGSVATFGTVTLTVNAGLAEDAGSACGWPLAAFDAMAKAAPVMATAIGAPIRRLRVSIFMGWSWCATQASAACCRAVVDVRGG